MSNTPQNVYVFGVRHHGPGSARSLVRALEHLKPDIILVEGPPDANDMIPFLAREKMKPPVALLVYAREDTSYAAFFPFAVFSPEYQALRYALAHQIPARFMDLPQRHMFRLAEQERERLKAEAEEKQKQAAAGALAPTRAAEGEEPTEEEKVRLDPLGELARAAGYEDGEKWWEHMVEQRQDETGLFDALLEALAAVREKLGELDEKREPLREAYMRKTIREAQAAGHQRIAVVCGAWHAPALHNMPDAQQDTETLATLDNGMDTAATWVPWTNRRLSRWSGYGAGIHSPGWYHYLWTTEEELAIGWLTKVAHLLREERLDASTAQVIDAVRLAETLAAIRGRPMAGLEEFNEAALTVMANGNEVPMNIIAEKLIIGDLMGTVPDGIPMVPLQRDLNMEQTRLRLRQSATATTLKLDLRTPEHLERSQLLHRLRLLHVPWGVKEDIDHNTPGTFREYWSLGWEPEYTIQLIEKSAWGSTIEEAATEYALHVSNETEKIPELTHMVNLAILADLPGAVRHVVKNLGDRVALSGDVKMLMDALPSLAEVYVYGDIRATDVNLVHPIVDSIITRTCISLSTEVAAVNDDAARDLFVSLLSFHEAVMLVDNPQYTRQWYRVLRSIMTQETAHNLIRGRACRLLVEVGEIITEETVRQMRLVLGRLAEPAKAASWLQGFLEGSGLILLHHDELLPVIDKWVVSLDNDRFEALLPLLRRTFASFTESEVKRIGSIVSLPGARRVVQQQQVDIDEKRAASVNPMLDMILGRNENEDDEDNNGDTQ
ncbi:MAG: DUF5682 family protein [Chloroflexota bacterium]